MRFFATAAKGTEPALRDELRELRLPRVRADRGGVHFEGEMEQAARACLWSRVAARVLLEVGRFPARGADALYEGVRALDWRAWMTPRTTLSVRASCRSSELSHSQFVAQKTKDAVVDALRDHFGARPSVDRQDADVGLAVHLAKDEATIYLDVGGASLHERGWRTQAGEAPLRENLAAAVVRLSGWDRERPFIDPMCGAGTLAVEAATWARRVAPGLGRARFGFERWASHSDAERLTVARLRAEAREAVLPRGPAVFASDVDPAAVQLTLDHARRAGVELVVERRDVRSLAPLAPPGFVVTNPPYGERLPVERGLYEDLARVACALRGHTVAVLAGAPAIAKAWKRKPTRYWVLFNGPLECRLLVFENG